MYILFQSYICAFYATRLGVHQITGGDPVANPQAVVNHQAL